MSSFKPRAIGITTAIAACVAAGALTTVQATAGGGGPDTPRCFGTPATVNGLVGTNGDDVIVGTDGDDAIEGRGGNDRICAKRGADEVLAGGDDDRVRGGAGRDFINGQGGNDNLFGNAGTDGPNIQFARGGKGPIFGIIGGSGDDELGGGSGNDNLVGQSGTDSHGGGQGFDGCFDEDPDSTFNSCEYGGGSKTQE